MITVVSSALRAGGCRAADNVFRRTVTVAALEGRQEIGQSHLAGFPRLPLDNIRPDDAAFVKIAMVDASPAFQSNLTMRMLPLLSSLILPYALVLITPGPNLLVVLRTALKPSWRRVINVAAGISFGATSACLLAAFGASTLGKLDNIEWLGTLLLAGILVSSAFRVDTRER